MNLKNIEKFLKKNYKKIIVVCLIILLFSNKMYENFSTTDALNAVVSTEKKVNDIFYNVDNDWARSKKGLYSQKEIKSNNITATVNVNAQGDVNANGNVNANKVNASGDVKGKRLCIGSTCIDENHLKVLTGGKYFSIQAARNDKNLNASTSNVKFENKNNDKNNAHRIIKIRNK